MNDVDIEMVELQLAAHTAARGVCNICDEALSPLDPKWASYFAKRGEDPAKLARIVGPVAEGLPYHEACLADTDYR